MAAATVSLFPRGVPTIATPNPRNRRPSLHEVEVWKPEIPDEPLPTTKPTIKQEPKQEPIQRKASPPTYSRTRSPSLDDYIGVAITTSSPLDGSTPSQRLPPPPPKANARAKMVPKAVPSSPELPSSRSGSPTLVQDLPTKSPVVPIRSMFPTYNPTVPLNQQSYYPQRPFPARMSSIARNLSRQEYRSSLSTPIDRAVGVRTAPASVLNFPPDVMSISEPQYSSHKELEKLWEASHGMEPSNISKAFNLEMSRNDEATFTFGADPQFPFYTLKTFDTGEISVSKTSPSKRSESHDIIMSSLEPPERRIPPHDGLVAFIFPKMAAILALNQSAELAKQHHLASTDKDDIESAAVRRAAEQEACHLRWNNAAHRYELDHPAIRRRAKDPDFLKSPMSPQLRGDVKPVLHITVSSNSMGSPVTSAANPPVILVTNPYAESTPSEPGDRGIRLSTLPQSDLDAPLASLHLGSMSLHIDAKQILTLMPSLFAIDAVISAVLAIAVADETTNPVLAAMDIWMPRPKAPRSHYAGSVMSTGSKFYATIAEREEAEEELAQARKEHEKDIKANKKAVKYTGKRKWYGAKEKQKSKKKVITMAEIDLEKLGTYQSGERKGQELPAPVRGVMTGLVASLRFVVWFLTLIVQFVCWMMHGVTRGVTSEKF